MGTAGIAQGEKGVLRHPQREPLQLAVTQQAGRIEVPGTAQRRKKERVSTAYSS